MSSELALSITQPVQLTDAMLISTDIPENDYAAWSAGTTYALGARVILTSTHAVYESLQASNLGKDPTANPTWWIEVSPTNRWKAFDYSNSTQTVTAGGATPKISYTIRPGAAISSVAVLNVANATSLLLKLTDPVYGVVYSRTVDFTPLPRQANWWSWFFGQKVTPTQYVATDVPAYPNADLLVQLSGNSSLAVGVIMFGQQKNFGLGVSYGARVGIQDYSVKQTNEFGDTELLVRAFAKRANFSMLVEKGETDALQNFLADVRAVPCLWVGSTDYESTTLFGFYKNFDVLISYPQHSECELEIEGLT